MSLLDDCDQIVCPICECTAYEWRVCDNCKSKVGIDCCTTENDETTCNDCKDDQ